MRGRSAFAGAILGGLALFGVGGCSGPAVHEPGVLRLAQVSDPSTLDPARAYDTTSIPLTRLLYRGLVDYGKHNEIVDELAASHSVSKDGKTYTFHLRPNIRFHSGRKVTSDDFRFALERVMDPATTSDGISMYTGIVGAKEFSDDRGNPVHKLQHITGIELPDENTIVFHLKSPDATFLNLLTLPFSYAVPRDYVEQIDKDNPGLSRLSDHPNGTGPFKFADWVHDASVTLVKNPDYFRPELPRSDRVEVQCGIQPSLSIMMFEGGKIDVLPISDAFPPEFVRITRDPKWKPYTQHAPMMDIRYVSLNNTMAPFNDVRVRQAVNYAVNRQRIANFLSGRAVVARGALPPGMPGYNPHLFQYPYDPEKARALLKAAGYKNDSKKPIELWYSDNESWYEKAAQSMSTDLSAVGMDITLVKRRYSEVKAQAGKPDGCEMAMLGWLQDYPDPSNFMDILFNKKSIQKESSLNRCFYNNPKVNSILDAALGETDRAKRLKMYQNAEDIVVHDAPMLFMLHTERYMVYQPWVDGFQISPMWAATYENVAVR